MSEEKKSLIDLDQIKYPNTSNTSNIIKRIGILLGILEKIKYFNTPNNIKEFSLKCTKVSDLNFDINDIDYNDSGQIINIKTNEIFTEKRLLGKGSYGDVYLYEGNKNNKIAIKFFIPKIDTNLKLKEMILQQKIAEKEAYNEASKEAEIINKLKNICKITGSKAINKNNKILIIMHYMDGDLLSLYKKNISVNNIDKTILLNIIMEITEQLYCLYQSGFYYTDIKLENILFKCIGNKIIIMLGDLGSIYQKNVNDDENIFIATFPPINIHSEGHIKDENKNIDKTIILGIIILFLELIFNKDTRTLVWDIDDKLKIKYLTKFLDMQSPQKELKNFVDDKIKNQLSKDHKSFKDFYESLKFFTDNYSNDNIKGEGKNIE